MSETHRRKLPLDFKWWAVMPVYVLAIGVILLYGWVIGAIASWMLGAFIFGLIVGLPAAKWEMAAIITSWEQILTGPRISFRLAYYKKAGARKRTQYFIAASFLIPLVFLLLAVLFYLSEVLASVGFGWSIVLILRWYGWYWLPYILGVGFSCTSFPRLVAAGSYGEEKTPLHHEDLE